MSNKIRHTGVVESVTDECLKVRITQSSACSGCKIAAHCTASDQKEKLIDVFDKASIAGRRVGESVVVVATMKAGMKAVKLGFILPFLVLIVALAVSYQLTGSEPLAALIALASLIPYYLFIYLIRDRLRETFSFVVE
jgi:sigma-E factor negative regulatory protein RseC